MAGSACLGAGGRGTEDWSAPDSRDGRIECENRSLENIGPHGAFTPLTGEEESSLRSQPWELYAAAFTFTTKPNRPAGTALGLSAGR